MYLHERWEDEFIVGSDDDIRKDATQRGDFNPIHHNAEAALRNKLKGIIAPGMLSLDKVASGIGNKIHGVMVHRITMKFKNPLYAGSMPHIIYEVVRERRISAEVNFTVSNGFDLVAVGSCELLLPRW